MQPAAESEWSERQGAVLDAVLELMVEAGEGPTMTAVARRANCSKETLYKWFGGRDGLLTATVRHQAARVRPVALGGEKLDHKALKAHLERFAGDWLAVIAGETSVALNRLAIGQAGGAKSPLGAIVLENGPIAMGRRLAPVLDAGAASGLLSYKDRDSAFRTFFGLVMRDLQIRLLLGERAKISPAEIASQARRAAEQFLVLYGAGAERGSEPANLETED